MRPDSGFTLLEILIVITIIAVTSLMVAPSFFSASKASIHDEAKRLVQLLRLAQEEAALSGQMYRVLFRSSSYSFEQAAPGGQWRAVQQSPYQQRQLAKNIRVIEIKPQPDLTYLPDDEAEDAEPVIAQLLLASGGAREIADIVLAETGADQRQLVVQFRPGPGGIQIRDEQP